MDKTLHVSSKGLKLKGSADEGGIDLVLGSLLIMVEVCTIDGDSLSRGSVIVLVCEVK